VVNTLPLPVDLDLPGAPLLDLSKVNKLEDLLFRCGGWNVQQITMALQTVQSKHLQKVTIHPGVAFANRILGTVHQEWQDLDHLLVQFWNSHSIRPKFTYEADKEGDDLRAFAPSLLPELTRRGIVDLVEDQRRYLLAPLTEE
jgi:hypothetical protein